MLIILTEQRNNDVVVEEIVKALVGYGVPGIASLGLIAVIGYLLREKEQLKTKIELQDKRIEDLQESRRQDTILYSDRLLKANDDWSELKNLLETGSKKK